MKHNKYVFPDMSVDWKFMEQMTLIRLNELENRSLENRQSYLDCLRIECKERQVAEQTKPFIVKALGKVASIIRPYDLVLEGEENIPADTEVMLDLNLSKMYVRIISFEESFPLTDAGKRSISALELMQFENVFSVYCNE